MTRVGSRELKNRLGHYLARVGRGETLLVTDRGKPVAKLVPAPPDADANPALEEKLRGLAKAGHIRLAIGKFTPFKPVRVKGKLASRVIIEDRS